MRCTVEGFKEELEGVDDECYLDTLCIRWLRAITVDHGKEGEHADKLLEVVAGLLDIY